MHRRTRGLVGWYHEAGSLSWFVCVSSSGCGQTFARVGRAGAREEMAGRARGPGTRGEMVGRARGPGARGGDRRQGGRRAQVLRGAGVAAWRGRRLT